MNDSFPGARVTKSNRRSVTGAFVSAAAIAATSGAWTTSAIAQEANTEDSDGGLREVVVTANRREESVQKVGISVTAVASDTLNRFNITRPEDLQRLVPGMAAIPNAGTAVSSYSIRGVGQADASEHEEQPVAIYQDGVYVANSAASGFPIFDVQRAEVLRGPQGTLFGRNATGGLIQFISNQPSSEPSGAVEATVGDFNLRRIQGFINGGSDRLAARLAFYDSDRDGYVKNNMGENLLAEHTTAVRGQARLQIDDNTDLTVRLEGWKAHGTAEGGKPTPTYVGADGYPHFVPPNVDIYGTGAGKDFYGFRDPNPDPFVQSVNDAGLIQKRSDTVAATLTHNFGDFSLYSISSFADTGIRYREDTDGTPLLQTQYFDGADATTLSQELRLQKSEGTFRWTAGAFFFDIHGKYFTKYNLPTFCAPSSPDSCSIDRSAGNLPLDAVNGKGSSMQTDYTLATHSYATFAQTEYDFTEKLTGIIGARYTWDQQKYSYLATCLETMTDGCANIFGVGAVPGIVSGLGLIHLDQNHQDWSGKIGLNFKATDTVLVYASLSKGLKSAGYSTATDGFVFPSQLSFKPEKLYDVEVGAKTSFFDRRLTVNLSGYSYDYKDFQTFVFSGVSFSIVNKDAKAHGAELEIAGRPLPGLTANLGVSYNNFWVDGVITPAAPQGEKQRPIDAPPWSVNWGLSQDLQLREGLDVTFGYNGRYTGDRYFGIVSSDIIHGGGYVVHDVSVRLESKTGLSATLFANNVTDKIYSTIGFDQTFNGYEMSHYAAPRTLGISLGYKF